MQNPAGTRSGFALLVGIIVPKKSLAIPIVVALSVGGCVSRDASRGLAFPVQSSWFNGPSMGAARTGPDLSIWWKSFRDPAINQLVIAALSNSPTLEEALERINAARALARAEGSARFPSVDALGQATIQHRISGPAEGLNDGGESLGQGPRRTVGFYQAGFDARWELDLFGRVRSGIAAAERAADVAEEERADARVTLVAEVVRTYLEMRAAEQRRSVISREIEARNGLLRLVRTQQTAGTSGEFDVQRARATYEAARARLPAAELAIRVGRQRLATLTASGTLAQRLPLGRGYGAGPAPVPPTPANLLRWRPDIRRAERLVAQRAAEADVAYADLFPRFSLGGTLNVTGNLINQPILGTPVTVSGGPGVSIPLLDWGLRRNVLRAREAQWREAIASYRGSVLRGIEDVEIAMATVNASRTRLARQRTAVDAARAALNSADRQYRGGLTGLTERLQAETDLRSAELDMADAMESASLAPILLFKAIGAPNTAPPPPTNIRTEPVAPASWADARIPAAQ